MIADRETIYKVIADEREYQTLKWGENQHSVAEWLLIMQVKLDEAKLEWVKQKGCSPALLKLIQVVTVGVACMEQHGVGPI